MPDCKLPRVSEICKEMILFDQDAFWLKPKYLRRGRLVDAMANVIAKGGTLDPEWLKGHSGEADDDRVEHAEVLPYIDGLYAFLVEHDWVTEQTQLEVIRTDERYLGHLDWVGHFKSLVSAKWVIDLKCGAPPPKWITVKDADFLEVGEKMPPGQRLNPLFVYYERQVCLYEWALQQSHGIIAKTATLHLYDGTYKFIERDRLKNRSAAITMVRAWHDRQQFKGAS